LVDDQTVEVRGRETASEISRGVVRIYAELFGRGPNQVRTYVEHDYVLLILEESFTLAERTLVNAGNEQQVTETRRAFQDAVHDEFVTVVEEATARKVRAFISQVHVPTETSAELFLLEPAGGDGASADGAGPEGA
jgi:uncharacterized protein YbcI